MHPYLNQQIATDRRHERLVRAAAHRLRRRSRPARV